MFNLEKVSATRFNLIYYISFVSLATGFYYLTEGEKYINQGFFLVAMIEMTFTEMRLLVVKGSFYSKLFKKIYQNKVMTQLFLMTTEFLLFLILLFVVVWQKVSPTFFLGFFIAYFLNLIILVLSSKVQE